MRSDEPDNPKKRPQSSRRQRPSGNQGSRQGASGRPKQSSDQQPPRKQTPRRPAREQTSQSSSRRPPREQASQRRPAGAGKGREEARTGRPAAARAGQKGANSDRQRKPQESGGKARGPRNPRMVGEQNSVRAARADNKSQRARMGAKERQRRVAEQQAVARRRKIFILATLVAAIILTGVLGVYLLNNRGGDDAAPQEHPTDRWAPVACSAENVAVTFEGPTEAVAGQEVGLSVTVENQSGKHPCYFDAGWSNVDVTVTSGSDRVVSTRECKLGDEHKQLLLDKEGSTTFTVAWPGGIGDSACGAPGENPSRPGTYVARLTFADKIADAAETVFVLR